MVQKRFWIFSTTFYAKLTLATNNMLLNCQPWFPDGVVVGGGDRATDPCTCTVQRVFPKMHFHGVGCVHVTPLGAQNEPGKHLCAVPSDRRVSGCAPGRHGQTLTGCWQQHRGGHGAPTPELDALLQTSNKSRY